jgi:hypothetical protein
MTRKLQIAAIALGFSLVAADAAAVIGRPLTPISYAGVARRTVRRTAYVAGAATVAAGATAAAYAAPVTTLPPNCQPAAGGTYVCGTSSYRPYYQGTNLVYAPYP